MDIYRGNCANQPAFFVCFYLHFHLPRQENQPNMSENNNVKVDFAVGSEVSMGQFFKSSFAKSFVTNCQDAKSLNSEFFPTTNITAIDDFSTSANKINNRYSLTDFANSTMNEDSDGTLFKVALDDAELQELDHLRKQCQTLTEENRRLHSDLELQQEPQVQAIDNVFLQTQVDTLQWQLKQTESNRQMYRSLMKQVVHFLERTRKSLDILHTNNSKRKNAIRNMRSQSVYIDEATIYDKSPMTSPSPDSRFTRAKSVAQISTSSSSSSSSCSGFREFTWSMLKRNDPVHCSPVRSKSTTDQRPTLDNLNKTHDDVTYQCSNESQDASSDHVPPEKLSQEAFRLIRTIESLLAMREPSLVMVSRAESSSGSSSSSGVAIDEDPLPSSPIERDIALPRIKIPASNSRHEYSYDYSLLSNDSLVSNASTIYDKSSISIPPMSTSSVASTDTQPRLRRSFINATSSNGKTTDEANLNNTINLTTPRTFSPTSTSISSRKSKKLETNESRCYYSPRLHDKPKSASSAEDESGFSSLSSFHDVRVPYSSSNNNTEATTTTITTTTITTTAAAANTTASLSSVKGGCHTEIGLPEIPLDKINHRRWSSTPAEIQALFKKYKNGFMSSSRGPNESLSVWV